MFELLCFASMFARGINVLDFRDAAKTMSLDKVWLQVVFLFVKISEEAEYDGLEESYLENLEELRATKLSDFSICQRLSNEQNQERPSRDSVLTIAPEDTFHKDHLILSANPNLKLVICNSQDNHELTAFKCLNMSLNYYVELFGSILANIRKIKYQDETLKEEYQDMMDGLFWVAAYEGDQAWNSHLEEARFSMAAIEELVQFHEPNIRQLLTNHEFSIFNGLSYITNRPEHKQDFLKRLEQFVFNVLSLYNAASSDETSAEMIINIRQVLKYAGQIRCRNERLDLLFELLSLNNFANRLTKEASANRKQFRRKNKVSSDLTAQFKFVEELLEESTEPDK